MRRLWCGLANVVLVTAWLVASGCGGNFSTSVGRAQGDSDLPEYVQAMFRQPVAAGPRDPGLDPLGEAPGSDGEPADVGAAGTGGRSRQEGDPGGGEGDPTTSSPVDPPPDPYIEGDPTTSSPVDPPPDPYIEGDPTTSSPVDPPPDPYIEGDPTTSSPVDPPPDPYIEGSPGGPGGTEYQSVMPAHAKSGSGRLVDDNSSLAYQLWGAVPPARGMRFEYHAASQPSGLGGRGYHAAKRALAAWDRAAGRRYLKLAYFSRGTRGPARDGHNTISWRVFTGPETDALAAAWIWDDGSRIVEVDLALNLRKAFAINAALTAGEARRGSGSGYDLQALLTHELGHGLGLADLSAPGTEGATMYGELAPGELAAQTLSRGDQRGFRAALGPPIRRPGKR